MQNKCTAVSYGFAHGSFILANVNSRSRLLYAVARPCVVCRLSVCRLQRSCTLLSRSEF